MAKPKHHTHHVASSDSKNSASETKSKVHIPLLSVVAIIAIVLIVCMTASFKSKVYASQSNQYATPVADSAGKAFANVAEEKVSRCKFIAGQTTIYDSSTLAVTLSEGESTYYSGYNIAVSKINSDGCVIDVNGNFDYIAVGQIQRLGQVYITVTDVSN